MLTALAITDCCLTRPPYVDPPVASLKPRRQLLSGRSTVRSLDCPNHVVDDVALKLTRCNIPMSEYSIYESADILDRIV